MRALLLILALAAACPAPASAQEAPGAREAYIERRGLLETDARCRMLAPSLRDALNVGAMQARGALLRAGWSSAQIRELEGAVVAAARARPCNDPRTSAAAAQARASVGQWANSGTMAFPGWERTWVARRESDGWRLSQAIDAPINATFGIRQVNDRQRLVLIVALARGAPPPASAQLVMRDPARERAEVNLAQRIAYGLEAGAPPATIALSAPATRTLERAQGGGSAAVFTFPDAAFAQLLALDPRESVEVRLRFGNGVRRVLIEVGDVAAARAFLTIQR